MVTILHLEDDLILLDIFKTSIEAQGVRVNLIQCLRGVQVLEYAQSDEHNINLYILDIRVRGRIDGIEVARRLRESGVKTPIILSSAYERPAKELLRTLNCLWVPKPWSLLQFLEDVIRLATKESQEDMWEDEAKTLIKLNLYDLLQNCMARAYKDAKVRNIRLKLNYREGDDMHAFGNVDELQYAFTQLIQNGIQYGIEDGNLVVSLVQSDDKINVSIKDDGIGISPEYHEKIFERFFYIDDEKKSHPTLTRGEGLYIAQQIIKSHGGLVSVQSALDKGSEFTIILPLASTLEVTKSS